MAKITIFKRNADGRMPWSFRPVAPEAEAAWKAPELTPREIRDLVKLGVWAAAGADGAAHNWLRPAEDGEVWAGNIEAPFAPIAKVRGKQGRIPGGNRPRIHPAAKVRTVSIQMSPAMRQELEAVAAEMADKMGGGRRFTISNVIQNLVDTYLEDYKKAHDIA